MSGYNMDGYIDVPSRMALFYKRHPEGSLQMDPIEWVEIDGKRWALGRAYAYRTPDDPRPGIGTAWEIVPGTTSFTRGSEVQNLETSAWGRAIGSLGIGIDKSIATLDEIEHAKARNKVERTKEPTPSDDPFYTLPLPEGRTHEIQRTDVMSREKATDKQIGAVKGLVKKAGAETPDAGLGMINDHLGTSFTTYEDIDKLSASQLINHYKTATP
jgi:hypothetical protein